MDILEYSIEDWKSVLNSNLHPDPLRLSQSMKSGIPDSLRPSIWVYLTITPISKSPSLYSRLQINEDTAVSKNISKDLSRIFPTITPSHQSSLLSILIAYSQFDLEVGYCQGMSFVAATLLLIIKSEEPSFWALVYIMFDLDWRSIYLPGTPKLNYLLSCLYRKLETNTPEILEHLKRNEVEVIMLSQHFLTILAYKVKHRLSIRAMDVFLCTGGDVIVQVLFNMIRLKGRKILSLNGEYLFRFLLEIMLDECYEEYHISALFSGLV